MLSIVCNRMTFNNCFPLNVIQVNDQAKIEKFRNSENVASNNIS